MASREDREPERARRLAEHVERIVAEAPPLTREQRDRLAVLLRPTPSRRRADTPE